jgi:hypothetical protein
VVLVADTVAAHLPPPAGYRDKARSTPAWLRRVNNRERDFLDATATAAWPPIEKQRLWLDALARRAAAAERP